MNSQTDQKSLIALIGLIALTLIIPLTVFVAKNSQDLRKRAAGNIVGLTITPNAVTKNAGETFISHIWLDTGDKKIGFAKIKLVFDNTVLNLAGDIVTTDKMSTVISKSSVESANTTGIIEIVLGVAGGNFEQSPMGAIDFATLSFKTIRNGSSTVTFDTDNCRVVQIDDQLMAFDNVNVSNAEFVSNKTDGKLVVTSANLSYALNQDFTAKVMLNSKENKIGFAQVEIAFDKNILNVTGNIKTNPILSTLINNATTPLEANSTGRIKFIIGLPTGQVDSAPSGLIELAEIPLKGISNGNGKLTPNNGGIQIASIDDKILTLSTQATEILIGPKDPTPTVSPGVTVTPLPTLPPESTGMGIKFKINGITSARSANSRDVVKVTLVDPVSGKKLTYPSVIHNVDANGVFELAPNAKVFENTPLYGVLSETEKTPLQLYLKWSKSLQKKYPVSLSRGINNINLTERARDYLDACDVPDPNNNYAQDGVCNSVDYALVLGRVSKTDADSQRVADLNIDGVINGVDLNILVNSLITKYEDEIN